MLNRRLTAIGLITVLLVSTFSAAFRMLAELARQDCCIIYQASAREMYQIIKILRERRKLELWP